MDDFKTAREVLDFQLRELVDDRVNYRAELALLRERIAATSDEIQRRALAGELGGLMKRWSGFVIAELTATILGAQRPGRERVRAWQKTVFGKSCASSALARYSETGRSGGGRGEPLVVPEAVEQAAKALFVRYVKRFKDLY